MTGDKLFQMISVVALAGAMGLSALHFLAAGRKVRAAGPSGGPATLPRFGLIERLIFLGFAATFLILAVSGLAPGLLWAGRLTGYLLMLHVGTGGAFIAFLLLLGLAWAGDCRYRPYDAQWCCSCCRPPAQRQRAGKADEPPPAGRFDASQKTAFWAAMVLGAVTAATMLTSMLPIFGPQGLEVLRDIHRYCGLAFVVVAYGSFYQTVIVRRGRLRWLITGKVDPDWARHYRPIWWRAVTGEEAK